MRESTLSSPAISGLVLRVPLYRLAVAPEVTRSAPDLPRSVMSASVMLAAKKSSARSFERCRAATLLAMESVSRRSDQTPRFGSPQRLAKPTAARATSAPPPEDLPLSDDACSVMRVQDR